MTDLEQLRAENARLRETTEKLITALDKIEQQADYGQVDACQRIARAALSADPAPVGDEWQPIETAPRDCRCVLLATPGCDEWSGFFVAYWSKVKNMWLYSVDRQVSTPTHWMPLPKPPVGENGND